MADVEPKNARTWYRLTAPLHETRERESAIAEYQKSIEAGLPAAIGEYKFALANGTLGETEKSLEFLERAVKDGFNQPEPLRSDSELAVLRDDERFSGLLEQVKKIRSPLPIRLRTANLTSDWENGMWMPRGAKHRPDAAAPTCEKSSPGVETPAIPPCSWRRGAKS